MARVHNHKTTTVEMKQILELHLAGKSKKEITDITGRGPDTINKILAKCGLASGHYSPESVAWRRAQDNYDKICRKVEADRRKDALMKGSHLYSRCPYWRELSSTDAKKYYDEVIDECKAESKAYFNMIMGIKEDDSTIETHDISFINKLLEYCNDHESDDYQLFHYVIPNIIEEVKKL